MNVTPKRTYDDKIAAIQSGDGLWVECEVTYPPSSVGRTVYLFVPPELITSTLLELRDVARDQRATPEAAR